jgi:site-specific DNA-methyltransferase (adenine-specific)
VTLSLFTPSAAPALSIVQGDAVEWLFFEKGKRRLNDLGVPDVLAFDRVHGGYPTEKPVDLLRVLVTQSSIPGELVIDPFTGSCSTGEAARLEGRRFAGCDVKASAVTGALARVK